MTPSSNAAPLEFQLASRDAFSLKNLVRASEKVLTQYREDSPLDKTLLLTIWTSSVDEKQVASEVQKDIYYVMLKRNRVDEEVRELLKTFCQALLSEKVGTQQMSLLTKVLLEVKSKHSKILDTTQRKESVSSTPSVKVASKGTEKSPLPQPGKRAKLAKREQRLQALEERKRDAEAAQAKNQELFAQAQKKAQESYFQAVSKLGIESGQVTREQYEALMEASLQSLFRKAYLQDPTPQAISVALGLSDKAQETLMLYQKEREVAARQRNAERKAWEESLVPAAELMELLGITKTEFSNWKQRPELVPALTKSFKKWGKTNSLQLYDARALRKVLTPDTLQKWRDEAYATMSPAAKKARARSVERISLKSAISQRIESTSKILGCTIKEESRDSYVFGMQARLPVSVCFDGAIVECVAKVYLEQKLAKPSTLLEVEVLEASLEQHFSATTLEALTSSVATHTGDFYDMYSGALSNAHKKLLQESLKTALMDGVPALAFTDKASVKGYLTGPIGPVLQAIEEQRAKDLLRLQDYPQAFPLARQLKRRFHFKLGPTNSGKTHEALEALKAANSGVYLAPLRLLAMEIRDRLTAHGIPCNLLTGEEHIVVPGATHTACTVEMLNPENEVEVAVIDEIQMLDDPDRGWAWTSALIGVPAATVYVCGADTVHQACIRALTLTGEAHDTTILTRKTTLQVEPFVAKELKASAKSGKGHRKKLKQLEKGDAVIAFSRKDVLTLSARYREEGYSVATIYGALVAEVRRTEAERFNSGKADILVATDAIGMGLNLPIRRVIFSAINKFDGTEVRLLNPTEVHQIAGRAGRFGIYPEGIATTLDDQELSHIRLMLKKPVPVTDKLLPIAPSIWHIEALAEFLGTSHLGAILSFFCSRLAVDSTVFETASLEDTTALAHQVDALTANTTPAVSLKDKFNFSCAPVSVEKIHEMEFFKACLFAFLKQKPYRLPAAPAWLRSTNPQFLEDAEQLSKNLGLYAWLGFKYPQIFPDQEELIVLRGAVSRFIEKALLVQGGFGRTSKESFEERRAGNGF